MTSLNSEEDSYHVNWKTQQSHIVEELRNLFCQVGGLLDVTLACDGEYIQAHKLVLSMCSSFFKDLFQKNRTDHSNTIIILGNVTARNMRYLLRYMYEGRVEVPSRYIDSFLEAGNVLKVEGLVKTAEDSGKNLTAPKRTFPSSASTRTSKRFHALSSSSSKRMCPGKSSSDEEESDNNPDFNSKAEPLFDEEKSGRDCDNAESDNDLNKKTRRKGHRSLTPPSSFTPEVADCGEDVERRRSGKKRKSVCWQYFQANQDHTEAMCKLCTDQPTILKTKDGNTSGLLHHLQRIHPGVIEALPLPSAQLNASVPSRGQGTSFNEASTSSQTDPHHSSVVEITSSTNFSDSFYQPNLPA